MSNNKLVCLLFIFLFLGNKIIAQKTVTSRILDFEKAEPVQDVSVRLININKGAYSDENGVFTLDNVSDTDILVLSKIGYATISITVRDVEEDVYLSPEFSALKEVVIRSFSSSQLKRTVPDQIYFSQKDIERLPFILGEKDVIKLIQYTPGVQQATEGQSGLLVRGGNGSMNLTLLDNIYLHNTAHLGGLFSAINSDFVESLEFSKAGFDAAHGGRLSSITDIKTLKSADTTYFEGSIGLLSAKLTGNIKLNKKNSLLVSGRRTYLEMFKPLFGDDNSILGKNKNYFLYDFLTKHTLKLSKKSNIETTLYMTHDNFKDQTKGRNRRLKWGNVLLGTTLRHQFSSVLSSQTTISNSFYEFSFSDNDFPFNYNATSTFNVFSLKHHFLWDRSAYLLKTGAEYNKNKTLPKQVEASVDSTPLVVLNQETYHYDDVSVFGDLELPVTDKIKLKMGLRWATFFAKANALLEANVFTSLEPRISIKYQILDDQAFKFSYQRLEQFVHQASISSFSLPADFFVISSNTLRPQAVNQVSLGYAYEENGLQINSGLYFKNVSHYTEFENGSVNNLFSNNIYNDILTGKFNSYGLEVSVNKKVNSLTVQGAITLSKTRAQFDGINQGNYFPATFDRPININTIMHYRLNNRLELGALFLFTSGQNYTRPLDIRVIDEKPILNFGAKNGARFPNYHRLDLSCTYAFKKKERWSSKLNLTLYNVYNNKNPFQIYFTTEGAADDTFIEITENKDTLFPFLPTVNWVFSF
ncbi:carboxypeptidase-like regulatory domain-containing protein [Mariniflexile ostreae]|uniref:Carboxypeptidase-like regulatory domain-containing protein n=1 Tax=Mariniflexile ostreae TaxID=1520892 RepID=A0ABV5F764_9FLAO